MICSAGPAAIPSTTATPSTPAQTPTNSFGDYELNDKVRRYDAESLPRAYLLRHYTPTGRLGRPMLALHTVYDPVVPVSQLALYSREVEAAGFSRNLIQQYVHRDGHCTIRQDEVGEAFDELVAWTHGGPHPAAGQMKDLRPTPGFREQALRPSEPENGPRYSRTIRVLYGAVKSAPYNELWP